MFDRAKWLIFLKVLPLTLLFCLAKVVVHSLDWEIWAFDSFIGTLFGAATFVVALVLGGTLSDYRASEGMPGQIANALETIHDTNLMVATGHAEYSSQPLRDGLIRVAQAIYNWLTQGKEMSEVTTAIADLNPLFVPLAQVGGAPIASRVQAEQAKIRLLVSQIQSHRDTDFVGPAYVLLWIFVAGAIVALLLIGADQFSENLTVSGFMFTSFVYMVILIRDLDNPFEYDGSSSVDVSLEVLENIADRL